MDRVDMILEGAAEAHEALGERLIAAAEALLSAEGLDDRELSLVLTDDENIRELNAEWRGEDKATDVLSFPMDDGEELAGPGEGLRPLGDIVISVETAATEAGKCELDLEAMAVFLLVHGFCHLLGHDHAEPDEAAAMREAEDRLLAAIAPGARRPPTPY